MIDLILPPRPELATMVVHTRQLLLRDGSPEALFLYHHGVTLEGSGGVSTLHAPGLGEAVRINYTAPAVLEALRGWLERHVRAEKSFHDMLGSDAVLLHILALAREQAISAGELRSLSPIRIHGPTGSGKELLAKAIHRASGVKGEFVAVHCAGITDELLESTLFGYIGGAFTGAVKGGRKGLVSLAEGGTLFLDEVGDLPHRAQVTLLRFLQDQRYRPVGEQKETQADVRVVCATLKNLEHLAAKGEFRPDLLYRLSGVRLTLPGLEARRHELLRVAEQMIRRAGGQHPAVMDAQVRLVIEHTPWPGNFRQLDMEMREAVRRANRGLVRLMHLTPQRLTEFYGSRPALRLASEILAWGVCGEEPSGDQLRARSAAALSTLRKPVISEEEEAELGLLVQVRSAFDQADKPHALLGRLVEAVGDQRALTAEKEAIEELQKLLPREAQEPIRTRLVQLTTEQQAVDEGLSGMAAELSTRLPGLFNVFQVVQSLPGVSEHEKRSLFRAIATVIQFTMVLLPSFAAQGIRRLASSSIEELIQEADEGHDPNNPFLSDRKPEDRGEADWTWLAQNTTSLREAAELSGHSRNTVKVYFERHGLSQARS
jgi:DNA-binding NtrC family response regulator